MGIRPPANIEAGMKFQMLTVVGPGERLKSGSGTCRGWLCRCECGKLTTVNSGNLAGRRTISCGCVVIAKPLAPGSVFGMLTTIGEGKRKLRSDGNTTATSWVRCECGNEADFSNSELRCGKRISCGCLNVNHYGENYTSAWAAIKAAIQRCHNPNNPGWKRYGGRGIRVCDEWRRDTYAFLSYIGPKPTKEHTLDRWPNNNGNYEPGNVRWATRRENNNNRRTSLMLEFQGQILALAEWAYLKGWSEKTIGNRLRQYGWQVDEALTIKPNVKNKRLRRYEKHKEKQ